MKRVFLPIIAMLIVVLLGSCGSAKKVAYFQNIDTTSLVASRGLYDAKILPKDLLTITVSTTDPQASLPFNLVVYNSLNSSGSLGGGGGMLQSYLVDNDGYIQFPVLGNVKVVGLTKNQCQDLLKEKIMPYMSQSENPVVTVRMASYRVTVLGEVANPGVVPVTTEKMSVLEAIASAGDLTIYG